MTEESHEKSKFDQLVEDPETYFAEAWKRASETLDKQRARESVQKRKETPWWKRIFQP